MSGALLQRLMKLALLSCLVLLTIPFAFDFFQQEDVIRHDKSVEIKNSVLRGYKDGRLSWKVKTDYIWNTKSKYFFEANELIYGSIYDSEGQVVIDSINAKDLKINTKSNTVAVYSGVQARVLPRQPQQRHAIYATDDEDTVKIKSDQLRYYSDSKRTYLSDNVSLTKQEFTIKPKKGVEIDNDNNIAYIDSGFQMLSDEFNVSGNNLVIHIDDDYSEMEGNLVFERKPTENPEADEKERSLSKHSTFLYADSATYKEVDDYHLLHVTGNLKVIQPGKDIRGEYGSYNQELDMFELRGGVTIDLENLNWMFDKEVSADLSNDDIKSSLNQKTSISCESMLFDGNKNETKLLGKVVITQADQVITADKVIFVDENAEIECFGNVKVVRKDEESLSCAHLVVNIKKEQFLAKERVYSEFIIKKGEKN